MDKHPINVPGWSGSLDELARAVGSMRYDKVGEFLLFFQQEIVRQAEGDAKAERNRLSCLLEIHSDYIRLAKNNMDAIWNLCKKYM